jgi:hypothetical protein
MDQILKPKKPKRYSKWNKRLDSTRKDDLTLPIFVMPPDVRPRAMHENDTAYNRYLVHERELAGKRTVLRVGFEAYARTADKGITYVRLRNKAVLVSLPSGRQAELMMSLIQKVVQQFDGKLLAEMEDCE